MLRGPYICETLSSWAHVSGFLSSVQSAPSIPLLHMSDFVFMGTFGLLGIGLGAMGYTKLLFLLPIAQQPDSKGQWIKYWQSVTSN